MSARRRPGEHPVLAVPIPDIRVGPEHWGWKGSPMSGTFWLLIGGGLWLVVLGTLRICASAIKDVDRAQSEIFAAARRARFNAPAPSRRADVGGWTASG